MAFKRFFAVTDTHGLFLHENDWTHCMNHHEEFQPDFTIHMGDGLDATCCRIGASDQEQSVDLAQDLGMYKRCLTDLQPNVVLMGNHENRLWKLKNSSRTQTAMFAESIVGDIERHCKSLGADMRTYNVRNGVYQLPSNGLKFMHGFHTGINACKKHAEIWGDCLIGHIHRIESKSVPRDGGSATCYSIGCMCDFDNMEYMSDKSGLLAWDRGWAFGYYNEETGAYKVHQAQKLDGEWLI